MIAINGSERAFALVSSVASGLVKEVMHSSYRVES
jgi:hypothetical protein